MSEPGIKNDSLEYVNCNLCGSAFSCPICSYGNIIIVKCRDCGLVYRNPRLKESLNREFYSDDYYGGDAYIEERISGARINFFRKVLFEIDRKCLASKKKILDIGCGQGNFLKLAVDYGWEACGVELAKSACEYGREKFGLDIINAGIEEARFDSDRFDVITLWNVLDHLRDPLRVLREARRILKPGGIIVIRVPNIYFHLFTHKLFNRLGRILKGINDPSIIINYGFSANTLGITLRKAGFIGINAYNSVLSSGDPYRSFGMNKDLAVNILKRMYFFSSQAFFYLSFGRCLIGSSILAYARK